MAHPADQVHAMLSLLNQSKQREGNSYKNCCAEGAPAPLPAGLGWLVEQP